MIVLLTTWAILTAERPFQGVKTTLEYAPANIGDELAFALGRAVEFRRPFDEGPFRIRHRRQTQRRDIVLDAHRRFQDRIGAEHVVVGEAEQLFPDTVAVVQAEVANAADLVRGFSAFDAALGDRRVPIRHAVEVAHAGPDPIAAAVDYAGNKNPRHGLS